MAFNEIVFVTGFPGFLATRLVKRLAAEGARFILLIQPAYFTVARDVVQQMVRETEAPAENFRLVEGDITQPDLGLSADELARARRETGTIFHLAAIYDLAVAQDVAARVN